MAMLCGSNITTRKAINNVKINIITNKTEKIFVGKVCSYYGTCFPLPHFETIYSRLIEIQTHDGHILCFNQNVIQVQDVWKIGNCIK